MYSNASVMISDWMLNFEETKYCIVWLIEANKFLSYIYFYFISLSWWLTECYFYGAMDILLHHWKQGMYYY